MQIHSSKIGFVSSSLCILLAGLLGCSNPVEKLDEREERDPLLRDAQAKKRTDDLDGAIELYKKALDKKPQLARAHLELGLLYDKHRIPDHIRAIYHYERYVELRPQSEKRELIEGLIRQARISYAASLPDRPSEAIDEIAYLKREIVTLNSQLATLNEAAQSTSEKPNQKQVKKHILKPEPAQRAVQMYKVRRGDTLSSIASKMYNNASKWEVIYKANKSSLSSPENLKMGQTLIIPQP